MSEFEKFYDKTLRFLSFRPRSQKEIEDYLKKKKVEQSVIGKIVSKLKEKRFINDEEFVRWWIEQRTKIKPRAVRLIKFELKQKGIAKDLIDGFNFESDADLEAAKKLVERKITKYKNSPKQEIYQKLGRFLSGKGFGWEVIKQSIDECLAKIV